MADTDTDTEIDTDTDTEADNDTGPSSARGVRGAGADVGLFLIRPHTDVTGLLGCTSRSMRGMISGT